MKTKNHFVMILLAAILFAVNAPAQTEVYRPIVKEGDALGDTKPVPLALTGFSGEALQVLTFDLEVQGFKIINDGSAQFEVGGSAGENVLGRLSDRVNKSSLFSKSYTGGTLRTQAHALADDVVTTLLHRKGIGQSKIAFKVIAGGNGEIYIADFDGHNARQVTRDNVIIAAPCWVPGRLALFYTSYKLGKPDIFQHNLSTGARAGFARFPGSNMSPAVSPDGSRVAMILSKDGWTDLYVCNSDGTGLKRLTKSPQDESSPCWSPDGKWICYAGKLGERRSLCKISAEGGEPVRIATGVSNPTEPDWSPDGKWIAFTRQGGDFEICVVPAEGGEAKPLVGGEDPSWSANSRTLVFAREVGHSYTLSVLDVFTKQVKDVSRILGSNSQPSWAK